MTRLDAEDREAIRQVIYHYCRGIDRGDRATLEACYWPNAVDDHGTVVAEAGGFIDIALETTRPMTTVHMIGNVLIEPGPTPATARVESYFQATHRLPAGEEWTLLGRYLDRFEQRAGQWRIAARFLAIDHERRQPVTAPSADFTPRSEARGGKHPDDPLYRWLLND